MALTTREVGKTYSHSEHHQSTVNAWNTSLPLRQTLQQYLDNLHSLELDISRHGVQAKEWNGVCHDPVVYVAVTVEVRRRPEAVLLLRCSEVHREQLELDETGTVHVRADHRFLDELGEAVSVGLPPLFDVLEPRFGDVRSREASVVNRSEVSVGDIATNMKQTNKNQW